MPAAPRESYTGYLCRAPPLPPRSAQSCLLLSYRVSLSYPARDHTDHQAAHNRAAAQRSIAAAGQKRMTSRTLRPPPAAQAQAAEETADLPPPCSQRHLSRAATAFAQISSHAAHSAQASCCNAHGCCFRHFVFFVASSAQHYLRLQGYGTATTATKHGYSAGGF
jgi:hypothetical protein